MPRALVLTESSLLPMLWHLLLGRELVLVDIRCGIPGLAAVLHRLAARLLAAGRLRDGAAALPVLAEHKRYEALTDVYSRIFPAMAARFGLAAMDRPLPDYAQAVRYALFDTSSHRCRGLLILQALRRQHPDLVLLGGDDVLAAAYATLDPRPLAGRMAGPGLLRRLVNLAMAVGVAVLGLRFLVSRLRLSPPPPKTVVLGATGRLAENDRALRRLLVDILDDPAQAVLVFDSPAEYEANRAAADDFAACRVSDGVFGPADALAAVAMLLGDLARLYRVAAGVPSPEFRAAIGTAYKRLVYRGLFNRLRFKAFFGRDDYAVEHLVRRMELKRIGGLSLGINHGLPTNTQFEPCWTYLGFDVYYVFGRHLHQRYYPDTWDRTMTVRPVGSYGRDRARLARPVAPRCPDIVYYASPGPFEQAQADLVGRIADRLPGRMIRIKVKGSRRAEGWYAPTMALTRRHANVVETMEDSYDLMAECTYALCGTSTVAAEAIQFGMVTWVLDTQPAESPLYYRDFPGLCVTTADEVVARIEAIEAGEARYPRETYGELIDLSGTNLYDAVRADIGLPPKTGY